MLIIEDEPVVRGLIVEVVAELGFAALEASDGLGRVWRCCSRASGSIC